MFKDVYLDPYKKGSASAKKLAETLGIKIKSSKHISKPHYKYIKWGSGINKLNQYKLFKDLKLPHPEWTTSKELAQEWTKNCIVFARQKLSSHSGNGIVICESPEQIPDAPVYVAYKKKAKEFRVHVAFGTIIDIQEKRKKTGKEHSYIRNVANGYVYCRDNIQKPKDLEELALKASKISETNFAAVDIIWNQKENLCYVLEVNTAPGLEGTTLVSYKKAIEEWLNGTKPIPQTPLEFKYKVTFNISSEKPLNMLEIQQLLPTIVPDIEYTKPKIT